MTLKLAMENCRIRKENTITQPGTVGNLLADPDRGTGCLNKWMFFWQPWPASNIHNVMYFTWVISSVDHLLQCCPDMFQRPFFEVLLVLGR